jgi:hypothetical protein
MLKKPASGVLASPEAQRTKAYASPLRSLRPCWTAFLSILQVIRHYQPTYDQWTLPRKKLSFSANC